MITPRTTRLVRVPDLQAFRRAMVGLATGGSPLDARDRLVVVPTRAANCTSPPTGVPVPYSLVYNMW